MNRHVARGLDANPNLVVSSTDASSANAPSRPEADDDIDRHLRTRFS